MSKEVGVIKVGFHLDDNIEQLAELTARIGILAKTAEIVEPEKAERIEAEIEQILFDLIKPNGKN